MIRRVHPDMDSHMDSHFLLSIRRERFVSRKMFRKLTDKLRITKGNRKKDDDSASSDNESEPSSGSKSTSKGSKKKKRNIIAQKYGKIKKTLKRKVTGGQMTRESVDDVAEAADEQTVLIHRWISKCFATSMIFSASRMNQVFSPVPSMSAFIAVLSAAPVEHRTQLERLFRLSQQQAMHLPFRVAPPLPRESFGFFRMLVDEHKETRVNMTYMTMLKDIMGEHVLVSCRPASSSRYLERLSGGIISGPRSGLSHTTAYASAAVVAKWKGKVGSTVTAPFALSYSDRQSHQFLPLMAQIKFVDDFGFEAWSIPLAGDSSPYSLLLFRPHHVHSLLAERRRLDPNHFHRLVNALLAATPTLQHVLIPQFSLRASDDLNSWWRSKVPQPRDDNPPHPPMDGIWHSSVISVGAEGVGVYFRPQSNKPASISLRSSSSVDDLYSSHLSYSARFDTPFLFMVVHSVPGTYYPIIAGSYCGSPAAAKEDIEISCPTRIRQKADPVLRQVKSHKQAMSPGKRSKLKALLKRRSRSPSKN